MHSRSSARSLDHSTERRSPDRPHAGAVKPCPFCRAGSLVFTEVYQEHGGIVPAWACENPECEYRQFVRITTASGIAGPKK